MFFIHVKCLSVSYKYINTIYIIKVNLISFAVDV